MKSDFTSRLKYGVSAFAIASTLTLGIQASQAADDAAADEVTFEEVVVTGSRIKRADLSAPSPVAVVSAQEFKFSGSVNVEQVLSTLPQTIPGFGGSSNNPGNGTATVNLRGLGADRTLVLVNGRRYMPSDEAGVVDLNTIPAALVERVEVMTGGASAVYGSDAMAGVVNFILKNDFEGVEVSSQYDITDKGDGEKFTIDGVIGGNFADDRGNATVHIGYMKRNPLFQGDRKGSTYDLWDWNIVPGSEDPDTGAGILDTSSTVPGWVPGGSTTIPQGRITGFGMFTPDGGLVDFQSPRDLFNYAPVNYLQLPQERIMISANARYSINDNVEAYSSVVFAANRVPTQLAPTPAGLRQAEIDVDSPYLNAATQAIFAAEDATDSNPGDGFWQMGNTALVRRMLEVGPRQESNTRDSYQIQFGLRGDIDDWNYDINYNYARLEASRVLNNDINAVKYRQALKTEVVDGELVCTDTTGGCVPINPFGLGNISEEAADFVRLTALDKSFFETQTFSANVGRSLGDLTGGGDVGVNFGVEYRKQKSQYTPDQNLTDDNVLGFNNAAPVGGSYDVLDIFGEVLVPLVSDTPMMESLELSLAARYSDYSTVGGVWAYAAGLTWKPVNDLTIRGQYQRAVRAPNIDELFAGQTNGFPSATDPCASGGNAPAALCEATGVPAANVYNIPANNQTEGLFGGNPDLNEETSDTYTVGAVFTPEGLEGFSMTLDYYHITVDDYISVLGGSVSNVLSLCYSDIQDANSIYCQAVNRFSNGEIDHVEVLNANVSKVHTQGIDLSMNYSFDTDWGLFEDQSTFDFGFLGTHVIKNNTTPVAELPDNVDTCAGLFGATCGRPDPKWRMNVRATMTSGPLALSLRWRWLDSVIDDRIAVADGGLGSGGYGTTCCGDGDDIAHKGMASVSYFELSGTYEINENLSALFGVDNLFNKSAPKTGDNDQQANTFPETYDAIGRTFFFGLTAKF